MGYTAVVTSKTSRLLAGRNRLSRPEKEKIFEDVMAEVAPRRRARWWYAAMPALAAIAIVLVVLAPWRGKDDELTARGGGSAFAAFAPTCARDCTAGDKILFDLNGTTGYRYFAAFSQRSDGTVLWYFPSSDAGVSVDVAHVLDQGIVIGGEHVPGSYRVFGVFSNEPLSRAQIRERFDATRVAAGPGTSVIERALVVR